MKLFTGTKDRNFVHNPEGMRHSDEYKLLVQPFMARYFSYEEEFVCISVREGNGSCNLADAYGFQYELKSSVIKDIAIVCVGDFQNVIYAAYCALLRGESIKRYVECFGILPTHASLAEREEILSMALSEARKAGYPYAEARLYRSLCISDCINPHSGEQESIALLLLDEDEEEYMSE
jgi:hypothetical protein